MESLPTLLALLILFSGCALAPRCRTPGCELAQRISGRYEKTLSAAPHRKHSGISPVKSLQLAPYGRENVYFHIKHVTENGSCGLYGIAKHRGGRFVFVERPDLPEDSPPGARRCVMALVPRPDAIYVEDGNTCRGYCGAGNSFEGIRFENALKKPIALRRLRRSELFKQAVFENEKRRGL